MSDRTIRNYADIRKFGRGKGHKGKAWRRRRGQSQANQALDAQRQAQDADVDWGLVKLGLDYGNMTLQEAKENAVKLGQRLLEGESREVTPQGVTRRKHHGKS